MKTKYLLMSAAFLGLFAACSQDDVFEASAPASDNLANRPVVGEVELVTDEAETRYDYQNAQAVDGDAIGLYLMDEFRGYNNGNSIGELDNANLTAWPYQTNWWTMYTMVDYIQSNYGYVKEGNNWINKASQLVEGNYLVMLPKNDEATNRRDLWKKINPVIDMEKYAGKEGNYFVGRDNQFALDYAQLWRNQEKDANGNLTLKLHPRYILTYAQFAIANNASEDFIATKLVFKAHDGRALPNVAYIKPSAVKAFDGVDMPEFIADNLEKQAEEKTIDLLKDECGNVLAKGLYNKDWFTQKVARSLVQYASTEDGHVPYGFGDATPAYEYVFNFPDQTNGGVLLRGNRLSETADGSDCVLYASIALPLFEGWNDMEVVVYGKQWDKTTQKWLNGVLRERDVDNTDWTLSSLVAWESGKQIPVSNISFDDHYFYRQEEIRVATTEDLVSLLKARLEDATTSEDIYFRVFPYGTGLEVTDEVVKLIADYEKNNNVNVYLQFEGQTTQGVTPVILSAANCIDMFTYGGINVDLKADQTIKDTTIWGITGLTNEAKLTIEATGVLETVSILNTEDGTIACEGQMKATTSIHNEGVITLKDAVVYGNIQNENLLETSGDTNVYGTIENNNTCLNCGESAAKLNVLDGTLTISNSLYNYNGNVVADGNIVAYYICNESGNGWDMELYGDNNSTQLFYNYGNIYLAGYLEVTGNNTTYNKNYGYISIATTGRLRISNSAALYNYYAIFVEGRLDENLTNYGFVNVIDDGLVIVNGGRYTDEEGNECYGQIDVTEANDRTDSQGAKDRVTGDKGNVFTYTVKESMTAAQLESTLKSRISSLNYGNSDKADDNEIIIFFWNESQEMTFNGKVDNARVKNVQVVSDVTLNGDTQFTNLETAYGLVIQKTAKLTVANGVSFKVCNETRSEDVEVWVRGTLKVNNNAKLLKSTVSGAGDVTIFGDVSGAIVQVETAMSNVEWKLDTNFAGDAPGWNE